MDTTAKPASLDDVRHLGTITVWLGRVTSWPDDPSAQAVNRARIRDKENGLYYEATVAQEAGRLRLDSLTILTTRPDQRIDNAMMRRIRCSGSPSK